MNKKIGIIGYGFIGKILKQYYPEAEVCDKNSLREEKDRVLNQDIIFIAVNFQDNCISQENKKELNEYFGMTQNKIFIIKSTFVPGITDYFQNKYPYNYFIYNPEFLTERTAWDDFTYPQFQILGVPNQSLHLIKEIFDILPHAPIKKVISPLDAEVLKHAFNSYYGLKVIWFNQLYDACMQLGADYETIKEIMIKNPWVGDSHSIIQHKGYRGFGGKCLNKDPLNFTKIVNIPLLEKVIELNNELLKKNE